MLSILQQKSLMKSTSAHFLVLLVIQNVLPCLELPFLCEFIGKKTKKENKNLKSSAWASVIKCLCVIYPVVK
jgi:hypothetical protein